MIESEALFTIGNHVWCCDPGQKPMAEEIIGSRIELIVIILVNCHIVKLPSRYLYSQDQAVLRLDQKSFFQQWTGVSREIKNRSSAETKRLGAQCFTVELFAGRSRKKSVLLSENYRGKYFSAFGLETLSDHCSHVQRGHTTVGFTDSQTKRLPQSWGCHLGFKRRPLRKSTQISVKFSIGRS